MNLFTVSQLHVPLRASAIAGAIVLALTSLLFPGRVLAGHCSSHTICDGALGVAVTIPPGWLVLPRNKFPPHTLAFGTRPTSGLSYHLRLIIEPYATTSIRDDGRAASLVAGKLIRTERIKSITQFSFTTGGSRGVLVRGLPGSPGPAADIVVAHQKAVYLIIAPGKSLAQDQRLALKSLRFIPRAGYFLPPVGGGR